MRQETFPGLLPWPISFIKVVLGKETTFSGASWHIFIVFLTWWISTSLFHLIPINIKRWLGLGKFSLDYRCICFICAMLTRNKYAYIYTHTIIAYQILIVISKYYHKSKNWHRAINLFGGHTRTKKHIINGSCSRPCHLSFHHSTNHNQDHPTCLLGSPVMKGS